jgi:Flavodoxin domain/Protein of unknown function DUF86
MRSDAERLRDVLEAIERIEKHAARGKGAFYEDELLQTWILHHLLIVGEACRALSKEFRSSNPDPVWSDAAGLRNVNHVDALNRMPAALLSVSLSEAGAEDIKSPPARRARAAADAQKMINALLQETGWHPGRIKAVAGALLFTKYNFLLRFVMKRISRQAGGATDTSKDHEYTDWKALDDFIDEFVQAIPTLEPARGATQRVPSPSGVDERIRTFP